MNSRGVGSSGQQAHGHSPLARQQNSWFSLTLNEVENQLGDLGKPLGSMNLDELLKNVWNAEASNSSWMDPNNASPASSHQLQASLSLARAFNGKTVEEVWKDIQGHKIRNAEETGGKEIELTLGETNSGDPQKNLDRSLKRKIKNRESAARSRARKQAYHYELASSVSYLEEANAMLKKIKEFMKMLPSSEPRYQLRRTSSV